MSIDPVNPKNKNIGGDPATWSPDTKIIGKDPKTWWPPQNDIYGKDPATWSPNQRTDYVVSLVSQLRVVDSANRQEAQNQIISAANVLFKDVDAEEAKRCLVECFESIYTTENLNKEMRKLFEKLHDLQIGA